jgi:phthalate 4,5-dioxygenase reductase component
VAQMMDPVGPMQLVIARSEMAAAEIRLFELRRADGGALPEFTPGAHLHLRAPNSALRRYSLCNDPAERERYVIAVKREAAGRGGSISLVDRAKDGDALTITALRNDFALAGNPASYIFIAGGIGITPILSMIRHLQTSGGKPFKLYYLTRSAELTAFRAELSAPEYRGKVFVHHDNGDPARVFDLWPVLEQPRGAHVYCCGPRPLMEAVRDMTGHWSSAAVHFEDFGAGAAAASTDADFAIRLARSGATYVVPAGTSILEILRRNGHNIASSCEAGSCGTCRTRLLAGEADHRDLVLAEHERGGEIMVCVSRARSGELVLDL